MRELRLTLRDNETLVLIEPGLIDRFDQAISKLGTFSHACIVTDNTVAPIYMSRIQGALRRMNTQFIEHIIPAGEASKSLATAATLFEKLAQARLGRDGLILAVGGGVVSDLAGFVAASWLRGVRFIICPTTLEADVDACLGGKTAVNIPAGKNLVGAFHQPIFIGVDPHCLKTLNKRDIRAGLAESIKHGFIADSDFLDWQHAKREQIVSLDEEILAELIERNLRIKAEVVTFDALERTDLRILLNFGHTVGHGIESCCGYRLRHGECVGLGMLAAAQVGVDMGVCEKTVVERIRTSLTDFELPIQLEDPPAWSSVLERIQNDKKNRDGLTRMVLLTDVGEPVVVDDVPDGVLRRSYDKLCDG